MELCSCPDLWVHVRVCWPFSKITLHIKLKYITRNFHESLDHHTLDSQCFILNRGKETFLFTLTYRIAFRVCSVLYLTAPMNWIILKFLAIKCSSFSWSWDSSGSLVTTLQVECPRSSPEGFYSSPQYPYQLCGRPNRLSNGCGAYPWG